MKSCPSSALRFCAAFSLFLAISLPAMAVAVPYHGVTVSGIERDATAGSIETRVYNNKRLIELTVSGVTAKTLHEYAVVMNDATGEVKVAKRTAGPLQDAVVLSPTSLNGTVANSSNTLQYLDQSVLFLGSPTGSALYILKKDGAGNLLSARISFNVSGNSQIVTGTIVTDGRKYHF